MLDLDWSTILWETLNFLLITVILYFLVFRPMAKRAEFRALEKARLNAELEFDRSEAAVKLKEIDDRLMNFEEELQKICDEAYASTQNLQANLLDETRAEAEAILLDAVKEARKEQFVDIRRNQVELVGVVLEITKQTLKTVIPPEVHNRLLDELMTSIWNRGKIDLSMVQNLRESLVDRTPTVELSTPIELTNEQHLKLINTFTALADKEVDFEITIVPEMIAGLKARIGDFVMDNSLGNQVNNLKDNVSRSMETFTPIQDE